MAVLSRRLLTGDKKLILRFHYSGKAAAAIEESLSEDLNLIGSWLHDNSLYLNADKTEAMLFGTHARLSDADFDIFF